MSFSNYNVTSQLIAAKIHFYVMLQVPWRDEMDIIVL